MGQRGHSQMNRKQRENKTKLPMKEDAMKGRVAEQWLSIILTALQFAFDQNSALC